MKNNNESCKSDEEKFRFFQHKECEFFPCHEIKDPEEFNCLFCFCPLYALGDRCGGNFSYENEKGIKDCSGCIIPHKKDSYGYMCEKTKLICEMVKKK